MISSLTDSLQQTVQQTVQNISSTVEYVKDVALGTTDNNQGTGDVPYELYIIGDQAKQVQGSCATCQGTTLYLLEKHIPFKIAKYLDRPLSAAWAKDKCPHAHAPKMPVLHILAEDRWISGAEAIMSYMEQYQPRTVSLGRPNGLLSQQLDLGDMTDAPATDELSRGVAAVLAASSDDQFVESWRAHLHQIVIGLDAFLGHHGHAFIGGDIPNATDAFLMPRLADTEIAMKTLQGWDILEGLTYVKKYMNNWRERTSWKQGGYSEEHVAAAWQAQAVQDREQ